MKKIQIRNIVAEKGKEWSWKHWYMEGIDINKGKRG